MPTIVCVSLAVILLASVSMTGCLIAVPGEQPIRDENIKVPTEKDPQQNTPEQPGHQSKTCKVFTSIWGDRTEYNNPEFFLIDGTQSNLKDQYYDEVKKQINIGSNDLVTIGRIFKWKQDYFSTYAAGGKLIGKVTVNELIEQKTLSGCHDHGLLLVSILRKYKVPAIMVDTAGIQWALDYAGGKRDGVRGHVFIEAYVRDSWVLINSTSGEYVENYDPCNPVIPVTDQAESKGYYALFKGLDPDNYGIHSNEQLTDALKAFAEKIGTIEMPWPLYSIRRLPQK